MSMLHLTYQVPGDDFTRAGEASGDVKHKLKKLGYEPDAVRRVSIAMYEGEINMVIHADGGEITVEITPEYVNMVLADTGPGIADIDLAMKEGYSTAPDNVRSFQFMCPIAGQAPRHGSAPVQSNRIGRRRMKLPPGTLQCVIHRFHRKVQPFCRLCIRSPSVNQHANLIFPFG